MINFIIYTDKNKSQQNYKKIILNILNQRNEKYIILTITNYTNYTKEKINALIGNNIYILDMDMSSTSGLDIAKILRYEEDWASSIILTTSSNELKEKGFASKILPIDIIKKDEDFFKNMKKALQIALQIHSHYPSFNFLYNNEFYQIPYDDILYFEKNLNNNYTSIITKNNVYKIKESIKNIENKLANTTIFFKTHQSCIVNLKHIKKVNFSKNRIHFKNQEIDLLARNKKKELKERLGLGIYP